MDKVSALLVDDHSLFRTGLAIALKAHKAIGTVLEAASVKEAMDLSVQRYPAIDPKSVGLIVLDNIMPGLNGLDGMPILKRRFRSAKFLIMAAALDSETISRAREAGAAGALSKSANSEQVFRSVDACLNTNTWIHPAYHERVYGVAKAASSSLKPALSQRQIEVLGLLAEGMSNKAIGRTLCVSENTIRGHVAALLSLLDAGNRGEAVAIARRKGHLL
jgi:DNA-binding NarL/FixJ family response regulator